eukprot:8122758-Alexandrium_andersonii.AAC.1
MCIRDSWWRGRRVFRAWPACARTSQAGARQGPAPKSRLQRPQPWRGRPRCAGRQSAAGRRREGT